MNPKEIVESLFRWFHVLAGITWIGHLYFFNWVNSNFAPTLDADSKKKVVPELMPRALYFFRWGAAWTWITGVFLLGMVYYMNATTMNDSGEWTPLAYVAIAIVFIAPFVYDFLASGPLKDPTKAFWGGWVLASIVAIVFDHVCQLTWRSTAIHVGAMFGTIMAFNVWFRIWPNQKIMITNTKTGEATDAGIVAVAGLRSRHNTYMSVPLVFAMVGQHATWAATGKPMAFGIGDLVIPLIILVGWTGTYHTYEHAKKVLGF